LPLEGLEQTFYETDALPNT